MSPEDAAPEAQGLRLMHLTIFASATGAPGWDGWQPLRQEEVPGWVKDPDVLLKLAFGDMAHKEGGCWYRAVRAPLPAAGNDAPANDETQKGEPT